MTWVLAGRRTRMSCRASVIEADPVVNANVIAYLGDHRGNQGCPAMAGSL